MRKICIIIILSQITFFGSCQPRRSVSNQITIPMDITSHRPVIQLMIDGKGPYDFIFDTGSSTSVLDQKLNEKLGFKVIGEDSLKTQGSENRLVSQRVAVPKVKLPRTNISKDVEMSVVNLRAMLPVDGVLSGVFFEDYLVTIDYPNSELNLTIGGLNESDDAVTTIIPDPRVLNLNIEVDGMAVQSHLDTGSPGGFSLPYSMKDQLKFKGEFREGGMIRTPVASYKPWHAELVGEIKVGNISYKNPEVVLVEGFEYANIGYAVVKDLAITIDRKKNLIKFAKSSPKAEKSKQESFGDGETNDFTGKYEEGRTVYMEGGKMYFHRQGFKFELVRLKKDLYEMKYSVPVNNELPKVRFERNKAGKVRGITFVYKDGREDFKKKN